MNATLFVCDVYKLRGHTLRCWLLVFVISIQSQGWKRCWGLLFWSLVIVIGVSYLGYFLSHLFFDNWVISGGSAVLIARVTDSCIDHLDFFIILALTRKRLLGLIIIDLFFNFLWKIIKLFCLILADTFYISGSLIRAVVLCDDYGAIHMIIIHINF